MIRLAKSCSKGDPDGHQSNRDGIGVCADVVFGIHVGAGHRGIRAAADSASAAVLGLGPDWYRHSLAFGAISAVKSSAMAGCRDLWDLSECTISGTEFCCDANDPGVLGGDYCINLAVVGGRCWMVCFWNKSSATWIGGSNRRRDWRGADHGCQSARWR